jgi:hypothetical protein
MRLLTAILILTGLAVASGEGEDDVQLILGDEKVETIDCADDLQLAIEDVFDDIEVVQTVDLDATDQDFEIDPAFNVIVYIDEDIINGNCTAIIEDVLDIIHVPQVQVVTRGDHSYYYKSRSKSRSKHRCPYWKKRGFHGYHHKKWASSSRDDSDSEDRKKRWWMKKKKQGWRRRKFLRWWDTSDSDDGHWKNWKRGRRGSWTRSKGTDISKKEPAKKEFESSSPSEDPPKHKKKQVSASQDSVESERSRQPKPKVVRKKPSPPRREPKPEPKRKPSSPPKPKPEPKKKKSLRASHKNLRSSEEEEFN